MKRLLKLALVAGAIAAVMKFVIAQKAEWQGLTESQVRSKLDSRLSGRVPDEKRAEITDKVVSKMRERGVIREPDGDAAATAEAVVPSPGDAGVVEDATEPGDTDGSV